MSKIKYQKSKMYNARGLVRKGALAMQQCVSSREQGSYLRGFSIVEMLVVLVIFSVLAIIITQTLSSSLRSSRKSDAQSRARQNVDYAISAMERLLRNAQERQCYVGGMILRYTDEYGNPLAGFVCVPGMFGNPGYIASGSGLLRLTSNEVDIINCSGVFTCPAPASGVPASIIIRVTGKDVKAGGSEGAEVTSSTRILLRTY